MINRHRGTLALPDRSLDRQAWFTYWHNRAQQARARAAHIVSWDARSALLDLARTYERMGQEWDAPRVERPAAENTSAASTAPRARPYVR